MRFRLWVIVAALLYLPAASRAASFTWSSPSDALSMDPQAANDVVSVSVQGAVYEPLVAFSPKLELEPRLATSWEQTAPTVWRFHLRPGVRFHEGQPLTADDVVFSIDRGLAETSDTRQELTSIAGARKVDDLTVEVLTHEPDAILPRELTFLRIMNRAWAEAHGASLPSDMRRRQESFATRNANGTGPYRLVSREPDTETVFVRNPDWWEGTPALDRVVFRPVANDATRLAALLSGAIDMMEPVPVQAVERVRTTPGLRLMEGPETRIVYLGFDQTRDELPGSDVKGANPFRDVRVRRAVLQAIDMATIEARVLRGLAHPAATMIAPQVNGWAPELEERLPYDPAAAKALLAAAGYPDGFTVKMDCPNNRYVADEAVCKAIVPMLARVGIKADLSALPKAQYFPKLFRKEASLWMFGWIPPTYDAMHVLANTIASPDPSRNRGGYNFGGYRNPAVDALIASAGSQADPEKRRAEMRNALRLHADDVGHVPLYQQSLLWGVANRVRMVQLPDGVLQLRWVQAEGAQ
jgi:peptide/nickel transport system substrate-binding protein